MYTSALQDNLLRALAIVGYSVNDKSSLPVLSNVLLKVDGPRLMVATTNLDMATVCYCSVPTDQRDGAVTVSHKHFKALVSTLSPERIHMEHHVAEDVLSIVCGASTATFKTIDAEEFPILPKLPEDAKGVIVDSDRFFAALDKVFHAVSKEDDRPVLTGVNIRTQDDLMILSACDGFRLAEMRIEVDNRGNFYNITIPVEVLKRLVKIHKQAYGKESELLHLYLDEGDRIHVVTGQYQIVAETLSGQFPDLSQIIPTGQNAIVRADIESVLTHCKRASVYSKVANDTLILALDVEKQILRVRAKSSEIGEYEGVTDARIEGEMSQPTGKNVPNPDTFAITRKYLVEALEALPGDTAEISFTNCDRPCTIRPITDCQLVLVIMPWHTGR